MPVGCISRSSVFIIFLVFLSYLSCSTPAREIEIGIGGEVFRVAVARTRESQSKGLMFRKSLGKREGMIFVYTEDRRLSFWMKNTEIPLSIAFLNRNGKIIQIEDLEPFSLSPVMSKISVRYALEVARGAFRDLGVREGDYISLPEGFR